MAYDLAVIGGGPAGASAAMFAGRGGLRTVVIDADKGITRRAMLYNHLGFPEGITGPQLVDLGKEHALRAGAEWVEDSATSLTREGDVLVVSTDGGARIEATDVLLATGINMTLAKEAGVETTAGTEPRIPTIAVVDRDGRTSVPGIWAAGTAGGVSVHTIITAGDGARVAINIVSARRGERFVDHDVLPST